MFPDADSQDVELSVGLSLDFEPCTLRESQLGLLALHAQHRAQRDSSRMQAVAPQRLPEGRRQQGGTGTSSPPDSPLARCGPGLVTEPLCAFFLRKATAA